MNHFQEYKRMKAKMMLTEEINVKENILREHSTVFNKTYDWSDSVQIIRNNQRSCCKVSRISIYDDRLILNGVPYRILQMCSSK